MWPWTQLNRIEAKLDLILGELGLIQAQEKQMAADLTTITAQVAATLGVEQSAITLIQGLAADIASLKNDPAALQALSDQLKSSAAALSAAIAANPA